MRKLPAVVFAGVVAAAIAGVAIAASPRAHQMTVPLPDGSVADIQYYGDVAPKVTVAPAELGQLGTRWAPMALPSFAGFDRMIEEMNRRTAEMMREFGQAGRGIRTGPGGIASVASFGAPPGTTSYSMISVSNGAHACTRTTEVLPQGPGKPARVVSNVSGDCGPAAAPAQPSVAPPPSGPINHT